MFNVSWDDAQAYVSWLSSRTGAEYRLLSEAEWEYAARAESSTAFSWGDGDDGLRLNCESGVVIGFELPDCRDSEVRGNVEEWVEDCWNESYAGAPTDGSAWLSENCGIRVARDGSWDDLPGELSFAFRTGWTAGDRSSFFGFRVARTLAP